MKTEELYFKSENDAEAARSELDSFRVRDVSVEEVPEPTGRDKTFIPLVPGFTGPTGLEASPLKNKEKLQGERRETVTHLLRFSIDEDEYDNAMKVLENTNSFRENPEV